MDTLTTLPAAAALVARGTYLVQIVGDAIAVATTAAAEAVGIGPFALARRVEGLGAFVAGAGELRIGHATTADFELVYVYDRADGGFGYALNPTAPECSEWGHARTAPR